MKMKGYFRRTTSVLMAALLAAGPALMAQSGSIPILAADPVQDGQVIYASDFGADPSGATDSTEAVIAALDAARELREQSGQPVRVEFEKGEYQIYKDKAPQREIHTSNTNSIDYPTKTIGLLIENQNDLTIDGNGSLFMMHGNMMALTVVHSKNITLQNFSWDFETPTTTEMTILSTYQENGKDVTEFYIPKCFPYEISGTTINWKSEPSPYTGQTYWTRSGIHETWSVSVKNTLDAYTRRYSTGESPFSGVASITPVEGSDGTRLKFTYTSSRPAMQKAGMVFELNSAMVRETAGAMIWESENVVSRNIHVHYMHGFGWLLQMCKDVFFYDCSIEPRDGSGHTTASYADGIHASGAAGKLVIENCSFSDLHDDPINIHGTFTRAEQRIDDHTLQLKYIHNQQGGFPQYHVGDKVQFFTRDTLESSDSEAEYTVSEIVSNPGEDGNDLRTMVIRFEETVPSYLTDKIGSEPKYVAENVTYTPEVTIRNNTFRDLSARGILCTTRKKTLIEGNTFYNTSMATIYLSNDSNEWYESGPIRDMTIRGNTFYLTATGQTEWQYASAIYVHPVTKNSGLPEYTNPIHKNITIEDNVFHMNADTVVKAESVENLSIRNNKVVRTNPNLVFTNASDTLSLTPGASSAAGISLSGRQRTGSTENLYEFTKCKNVRISGNTYDDGQKLYAVYSNMPADQVSIENDAATLATSGSGAASAAHSGIRYYSDNPYVATVSAEGNVQAHKAGTAKIYASTLWDGSLLYSEPVTVTVTGNSEQAAPEIDYDGTAVLTESELTLGTKAGADITWSISKIDGSSAQGSASVDASGKVTFSRNGIYVVRASNAGGTDEKVLVYHSGRSEGLSAGFSIKDQNDKLNLDGTSATITLEAGDLYNDNNTVKNLIMFEPGEGFNQNSFKTAVYIENMPIKESGQWDTASFVLMKDVDNYISAGKKSHFNGIATVVETSGSATETNGDSAQNNTASGWVGFTRNGSSISVDFSEDGTTWTHVRDITSTMFEGSSIKIGFGGWHTNDRGKSVTFKNFKISDTATDYAALLAEDTKPFNNAPNASPVLTDLTPASESLSALSPVTLSYNASDADGDTIASTHVIWTLTGEDGTTIREKTDTLTWTPPKAGKLVATLYASDSAGSPAAPISTGELNVASSAQQAGLSSIRVAGAEVWKASDSAREITVELPAGMEKTQIEADSSKALTFSINGQAADLSEEISLSEAKSCVLSDGTNSITVLIKKAKDSRSAFSELKVNNEAITETPELRMAESNTATLSAKGTPTSSIYLYEENNPIAIESAEAGETLNTSLTLHHGINTFLIESRAEDGISKTIRTIHLFKGASSDCAIESIKLNDTALDLEDDALQVNLDRQTNVASCLVEAAQGASLSMRLNGASIDCENGKAALLNGLKPGRNILTVVSKAEDGVSRDVKTITLYVKDSSCTLISSIEVNENKYDGEATSVQEIVRADFNKVKVTTLDDQAIIQITDGFNTVIGKGTAELNASLTNSRRKVSITVTSPDGTKNLSREVTFEKGAFLSDLEWDSDLTYGYAAPVRDAGINGQTIQLCKDDQTTQAYEKGLGLHADTTVNFTLPSGEYARLTGDAGVDYLKHASTYANLTLEILADGTSVFNTGAMTGTTPLKSFDIDLTGVNKLTLKVTQPSNDWDAHGSFGLCHLEMTYAADPEIDLDLDDLDKELARIPSCNFEASDTTALNHWITLVNAAKALKTNALNGSASQAQIDALTQSIAEARAELEGSTPAPTYNYDLLDAAIAKAVALGSMAEFKDAGKSELTKALSDARDVRKAAASQTQIDDAAKALNKALLDLRKAPDPNRLP